jgi:hypothetical protein
MTFLQQLQAHKGGLLRLKTELYWYDGRKWDNNPGRICLILDTAWDDASAEASTADYTSRSAAAVDLLIDGKPAWIWVAEQDIELLVNDPPTN